MTEPKWWDCTLSRETTFKDGRSNPWAEITTDQLGNWLIQHGAERCVLGEEVGSEGYRHWQIRIVFHKPVSFEYVKGLIDCGRWSPTVVRNFDYCEKEGNFWRSWEGALRPFQTMEFYPWQNEVINRVKKSGDRKIVVLVDRHGNSGKTWLAKMITARHWGAYCPEMTEAKDYMAWALAHSNAGIFVLDMPRASDVKKDGELWKAVEQMKNGYLWDKRNQWREKWIDPPGVLVITNEYPDRSLLSWDRWDVGTLNKGVICGNMMCTIDWDLDKTTPINWEE